MLRDNIYELGTAMQSLDTALANLSTHLDNFISHFHFNDARQIAESVSKILFLNSNDHKSFAEQSFNTRVENLKKLQIEDNTIKKLNNHQLKLKG